MERARPPLALAALVFLLLLVAAIAALRPLASASAAGASARCGVAERGTGAGETLEGTAGDDLIKGRRGDDLIKGRRGDDCLRGGRGGDTVKGGAGRDRLKGGKGRDMLVARDGERDKVRCGRGKDLARIDGKDKVRGCERTRRPRGGGPGGGGSPGAGYPSLAQIDWDGDFDSGCRLVGSARGSWDLNETNADYTGGSTKIERRVVGEGQCAAKFGAAATNHTVRSELQRASTGNDPEFTYEMLVRVPSGQSFPEGSTLTQTKQGKVGGRGCYNGGWSIAKDTGSSGGQLQLVTVFACTSPQANGQRRFAAGPLPRDRWFGLKVHEKFSNNRRVGVVQAWKDVDGPGPGGYVEVVPKTHLDNEWDRQVKLRIGSYHDPAGHASTVYIDGVHLDCSSHC
jgi:polysaccharide lyase-like protein/hemolysin type calcium-binding protein